MTQGATTKSPEPPFLAGQTAFREGIPINANPFREGAAFTPDEYPGPWKNWLDGWRFAKRIREHSLTKGGGS